VHILKNPEKITDLFVVIVDNGKINYDSGATYGVENVLMHIYKTVQHWHPFHVG